MQLDDLKERWVAHGVRLERSLALNEQLLREVLLRRVRFTLAPYALGRVIEVVLGVALLCVVLLVLAAHAGEVRYLVVGGALVVFTAGIATLSAVLLTQVLRLEFDGPLLSLQRAVERIRLVEYRATKWAILGGVVLWLPAVLVLFEAVTGVEPLAHVDLVFLAGNLVFGLAVLVFGQALSRRYVERSALGPWSRRVVDSLSGRALRSASRRLDELARFERDESPSAPS